MEYAAKAIISIAIILVAVHCMKIIGGEGGIGLMIFGLAIIWGI